MKLEGLKLPEVKIFNWAVVFPFARGRGSISSSSSLSRFLRSHRDSRLMSHLGLCVTRVSAVVSSQSKLLPSDCPVSCPDQ